jgi:membrane associated rhomboid family serine protease
MVRPYYNYDKLERKSSPPPVPGGRMTPVVRKLIWANIAVFVAQLLLGRGFTAGFALSEQGPLLATVLRLFTYMFLHSTGMILHIVTNMFALYMLGPEVERGMGRLHFTIMYLLSGVLGGLGWLMLSDGGLCVGASGAIMGLVVSFAVLYPRERLALIFLPMFPIKAWILVLGFALLELMMFTANPGSTIAHAVHLAGGVAGCFYTLAVFRPNILHTRALADKLRGAGRSGCGRSRGAGEGPTISEAELDRILDKISRQGMSALSPSERRALERASERRRGRGR